MVELEGMALKEALAGKKIGAGIGAGGEFEKGEIARQALTGKGAGMKAAAAKGAGTNAAAVKGAAVKGAGAAKGTIAGKAAMAAKGAGATGGAAKTAAGGAFFSAKGLGLGLGLGTWGPVILGVIGATAVYGYWKKRQGSYDQSETDAEIKDALG